MFNYGGYPPQTPVIFIPSPGAQSNTNPFDLNGITAAIQGLEMLKKQFKEEKKDEKKKPEGPNVLSMMLLMILLSPITGPIMSKFFSVGLSYLPH